MIRCNRLFYHILHLLWCCSVKALVLLLAKDARGRPDSGVLTCSRERRLNWVMLVVQGGVVYYVQAIARFLGLQGSIRQLVGASSLEVSLFPVAYSR